jgi:hypothetical protein
VQHYYINTHEQVNGQHVVHVPRCNYFPEEKDRIYLGAFTSCHDALKAAKSHYDKSNGCPWCCTDCHTG